jgi:hypothetical protein
MQHSPPCWNSLRAGSRTSSPPIGTGARDPHIWLSSPSPRISFVTCHTPRWANPVVKIATCGRRPAGFEGPSRMETRLPARGQVWTGPYLPPSVRSLFLHSIGKLGRLARCRPLNRAPAARHGVPTRRGSEEPAAASSSVSGEYVAARILPCMCAVRFGTPPSTARTTSHSSTLPPNGSLQQATGERQAAAPSQPYCTHDRI